MHLLSEHVSFSTVAHDKASTNKIELDVEPLADIMQRLGHNHIDVLKMDIEGSEYQVIDQIIDNKIYVSQILVEFHDRFFDPLDTINNSTRVIKKLKKNGYFLYAVNPIDGTYSFVKTGR